MTESKTCIDTNSIASQEIYRCGYGGANGYDIVCTLHKGKYSFECKKTKDCKNIYATLRLKGVNVLATGNLITFTIDDTKQLRLPVSAGGGSVKIADTLREQLEINKKLHKIKPKRLIAEAINKNAIVNKTVVRNQSIDVGMFYFDVAEYK